MADQQSNIRAKLQEFSHVEVMPGTGKICVVYTPTILLSMQVRTVLKAISVYMYLALPANLRPGYYTIFLL